MSLRRAQACSEGSRPLRGASRTPTTAGLPRGRGRTCAARCIHINARRRDTTGPGMPGPYRSTIVYKNTAVDGLARQRRCGLFYVGISSS